MEQSQIDTEEATEQAGMASEIDAEQAILTAQAPEQDCSK